MLEHIKDLNSNTIEKIMRYIDDEKASERIPQPILIAGSRGSGKSTLLKEIISRLNDQGDKDNVQFFDGKQFFCSNDIIKAIESNTASVKDGMHRRIAIIDDLDFFFKRSSFDDQYVLRDYLNDQSAPLIIATISEINDSLTDYDAPFFEGIRVVYIPPFKPLLDSITAPSEKTKRLLNLLKYMPPVIRSVKIATDIISLSDNMAEDLDNLLDITAPSFRSKFESLPPNTQKILTALANSDNPLTLSELRELTDLPSGTLSTYLRLLVQSDDIRKTEADRRGAPYEMRDPLFKLWLRK